MKLTYAYDVQRGNLTSRSNTAFSWNETFTYDNLDRLTGFTDNNGTQGLTYDNKGRITANSRLGNYTYTGNSYQQTGLTGLTAFGSYHYQNQPLQNVTYSAFKQPVEIAEQGKDKISFQYNGDLQRSHMYYGSENSDKMARPLRRHYSEDGSMEITEDVANNKTSFVFYLGGDAYTAPAIWKNEQTSTTNTADLYYLHRDQLGSILLITDITGTIKEKRQFDAWGNIVKLEDGSGNALTAFAITDRGYTGHEHLLSVGLINMNGRLYDPILHRFLSPDNYVQDPSNTQNFNRYGYVLNNPLKYTDPKGKFFIEAIIGFVAGYVSHSIESGNWGWSSVKAGLASGLAAGTGAYLSTLFSSAIGSSLGTFGGKLAGNVVSSAIVGGANNVVYGDNFFKGLGTGAINGVISTGLGQVEFGHSWAGVAEDIAFGGLSGGSISKAFGGNFWAGFASGSTSSLLKNIAYYEATIAAKQEAAEDYLGKDFSGHPTDKQILDLNDQAGKLQYKSISGEQYNYLQSNYGQSTGNNVFDLMENSDIQQLGNQHFKIGNLHFRNYTGPEFGKIQPGYSVHWDNYSAVGNLLKHLHYDTNGQAKRGYL